MKEAGTFDQCTLEYEPNRGYWKQKHAFARVFYALFKVQMMALWEKINGGKELRPSVWTDFVESSELWQMMYGKFVTMSCVTSEMCLAAELAEDGMEALTQERETYFLVPIGHAAIAIPNGKSVLLTLEGESKRRCACQQLLKTVLMYFFADLYKRKFTVHFTSHETMKVDQSTISKPLFLEVYQK